MTHQEQAIAYCERAEAKAEALFARAAASFCPAETARLSESAFDHIEEAKRLRPQVSS